MLRLTPIMTNRLIIISLLIIFSATLYFGSEFFEKKKDSESENFASYLSVCKSSDNKIQCWEETMNDILGKKGLGVALDFAAALYDQEPEFARDCHSYMHTLGGEAYKEFSRSGNFMVTPKTSYCGYGFYHGFMEALIQDGQSPTEAVKFCSYVDKQLAGYTSKGSIACYHGIGHGAVDGSDPRAWGNAEEIIKPGLELCRKISEDEEIRYLCATGVFNSLAIALNFGNYGLKANMSDPYYSCHDKSEPPFRRACYQEMNTHALHMSGNDFSKAAVFIGKIKEPKYAEFAVEQLAGAAVATNFDSYDKLIKVCRSLSQKNICFSGLVGGILEHGKPNSEYNEAINFCNTIELSKDEKNICFSYLISSVGMLYPPEQVKEVCAMIGSEYARLCPK